jgi:hypothetical protein
MQTNFLCYERITLYYFILTKVNSHSQLVTIVGFNDEQPGDVFCIYSEDLGTNVCYYKMEAASSES